MAKLPFQFERTNTFESFQFHHSFDLALPSDWMKIAANVSTLISGDTHILQLHENGEFDKSMSIDLFRGIREQVGILTLARDNGWPIKVENMEHYNKELGVLVDGLEDGLNLPVNAHLFVGFAGKGSFGWHSDEGHVMCYMVDGIKQMETESGTHELAPGDWLIIPEGLKHKATNITDTVMISFGTGSMRESTNDTELWGNNPPLKV